jgi:hypothetical protein
MDMEGGKCDVNTVARLLVQNNVPKIHPEDGGTTGL